MPASKIEEKKAASGNEPSAAQASTNKATAAEVERVKKLMKNAIKMRFNKRKIENNELALSINRKKIKME